MSEKTVYIEVVEDGEVVYKERLKETLVDEISPYTMCLMFLGLLCELKKFDDKK